MGCPRCFGRPHLFMLEKLGSSLAIFWSIFATPGSLDLEFRGLNTSYEGKVRLGSALWVQIYVCHTCSCILGSPRCGALKLQSVWWIRQYRTQAASAFEQTAQLSSVSSEIGLSGWQARPEVALLGWDFSLASLNCRNHQCKSSDGLVPPDDHTLYL